jgi:hypothetical protein
MGIVELSGGRGTPKVPLTMGRDGRSGGRGTSGRARPKVLTPPSFRKDCEALGQSLKRAWGGADGERENLENPGGLLEKRETPPRWLNPELPIWLNPDPRLNPPPRGPKELLCAEQGIPQTTMAKPTRRQIRGGNVHLLCNKFSLSLIRMIAPTGSPVATEMSNSGLVCS